MRELNLDRLRTLVTIADLGSFAEAARTLHLAPPTVSLHIADLEAHIGAPLLVRGRGGGPVPPPHKPWRGGARGVLVGARGPLPQAALRGVAVLPWRRDLVMA